MIMKIYRWLMARKKVIIKKVILNKEQVDNLMMLKLIKIYICKIKLNIVKIPAKMENKVGLRIQIKIFKKDKEDYHRLIKIKSIWKIKNMIYRILINMIIIINMKMKWHWG